MGDDSDKIVSLAREILESGTIDAPLPVEKKINVTLSLKMLCFTTVLAAAGGHLVSTYVHEQDRPLNRYERIELRALIFYTAKIKEIHEELLQNEVEVHVGVRHFDDLTAKDFASARLFLQKKAQ